MGKGDLKNEASALSLALQICDGVLRSERIQVNFIKMDFLQKPPMGISELILKLR